MPQSAMKMPNALKSVSNVLCFSRGLEDGERAHLLQIFGSTITISNDNTDYSTQEDRLINEILQASTNRTTIVLFSNHVNSFCAAYAARNLKKIPLTIYQHDESNSLMSIQSLDEQGNRYILWSSTHGYAEGTPGKQEERVESAASA